MIKSMNIAWWVQRWSELQPLKPAICFEGETITYRELHARADRTSCWLQSLGIEKGDRVAVILENGPEFIELYLACSRLGAIFVPVNYRLVPPEIEYTLGHAGPRLLVFDRSRAETILPLGLQQRRPFLELTVVGSPSGASGVLTYGNEVQRFEGRQPFLTRSLGPADPEEPQVIMYTSGTTGRPKGAVLTHRKTFFNCLNADIFFNLHFDDLMLVLLPLFHSGGLFIQASPTLYQGATLVLHRRFDPALTYRDIERYGVTKLLGVPTVYRALLRVDPDDRGDLSSLRVSAIGGENVTPDLLERCREAGFRLRQVMGQTETSILLWASEEASRLKPGTVGRPVFHAEVDIVDRQGRPVKPGEVGEIVVQGSTLMKEYWKDPVKTEETLRHGWLHTGDLARRDEDGYFYLVDRSKDMFISGGENVYPAEVERVLREHPDIEEAAVVGVPDATWGEVGHAFVVPAPGRELLPEEVIAFCEGKLAGYKRPRYVTIREDLPRTALGKVRKGALLDGRRSLASEETKA